VTDVINQTVRETLYGFKNWGFDIIIALNNQSIATKQQACRLIDLTLSKDVNDVEVVTELVYSYIKKITDGS